MSTEFKFNVLLSFDLENYISDYKRDLFYKELEEKYWKKIEELTTTWKYDFAKEVSPEIAKGIVETNIKEACEKANINFSDIKYAYQLGILKSVEKF